MKIISLSAILLVSMASLVAAKPSGSSARKQIEVFGPDLTNIQVFNVDQSSEVQADLRGFKQRDALEVARQFAQKQLTNSEFVVKNVYKSQVNGITHVYLRQVVDGVEVVNGNFNINVDSKGRVISYGNSFYRGRKSRNVRRQAKEANEANDPKPKLAGDATGKTIDPIEALKSLAKHIKADISGADKIKVEVENSLDGEPTTVLTNVPFAVPGSKVPVRQVLIQTDGGRQLQPVWEIEVEMENNWLQSHVQVNNGKVLSLIDWVADASYNVFPFGQNDPSEGPRQKVKDPHDQVASPKGWHIQGDKSFTDTIGNNVYAYENLNGELNADWKKKQRAEGGKNLEFDFPLDLTKGPETYVNASITNLFYWNNIIHDLFYRYGFDEAAGNFQEDNGNRGGIGGDAVIAQAQDGAGYNNANFATPPDGRRGKMRMYVWNKSDPYRDGDLEAGIIIHEYAHGISNRLTGGPGNSGCLPYGEAGGMGEGWGDFFATILRTNSSHTRESEFSMGDYANGKGIRRYPYSTSLKTNPETYGIMNNNSSYSGVHPKGAVWANMLYEVYWNIVDKHGYNPKWFPPKTTDPNALRTYITSKGNTLSLQIVLDGLKLQPCQPTFTQARDAILQAEKVLTGGKFACDIWRGFAKRGLGVGARVTNNPVSGPGTREESFKLPQECEQPSNKAKKD
ncbi:uncharacterized protein VTP21DRAFT_721 [Calcarisporiella thermophila]|uniref:uncharacterized protein n=1 Tax=Calcarisporiella thermophila TaxID=911321 RepID=UPI003743ED1D